MIRLCGLHDGFNGAVGLSLSHVVLQGIAEYGELPVGLEAAEAFLGFHHAGGGPAQGHLGVAPSLDVAADLSDRSQRVFNEIGAGERTPASDLPPRTIPRFKEDCPHT